MSEILGNVSAAEQRDIDERAADLGRRSAEQRGARLMVGLVERISAYRIGPDRRYPFPLLQRHIADLTGLTHVHVSRVLSEFRDAGVMNLSKG
jgi:CRP/FNR family transcriptional regulator, anaerobic regulatory protein